MPNYRNGKIYKLVNSVDNQIYIGSTVMTLTKRKYHHKKTAVKHPDRKVYEHLNRIGWENVRIILIESVVAFNKDQLTQREQFHIDLLNPSLNSQAAFVHCPHGRQHSMCKPCGGRHICEHNRLRSQCKDCGGSQICEHNRRRYKCKPCGGIGICKHSKQKHLCKDCGGASICEHGKRKIRCKDCGGGNQICEHNRRKANCKDCNPNHRCYECNISLSSSWSLSYHCKTARHKETCKKLFMENFGAELLDSEIPVY